MALKGWIDRLRGRTPPGEAAPAPPPPPQEEAAPTLPPPPPPAQAPVTPPPGQLPEPAPPEGRPHLRGPAGPEFPVPPHIPSIEPPFTRARAPAPPSPAPAPPLPESPAEVEAEALPPPQDDAALREALARTEPELRPAPPPSPPPLPAPPVPGAPAAAAAAAAPVAAAPPAAEAAPETPAAAGAAGRGGWLARLKAGLARSTARLGEGITTLFRKRRLDDAALEELEETLIAADLGVAAARRIVEGFRRTRFGKEVTEEEVKAALAEEISAILAPVALPMAIEPARAPHVVLVVGVNGTGKTTTIAKLGQQYRAQGLSCMFAAGDTFRAAAVEQLQIWGERTGCPVVAPARPGADAAGLAFDALQRARETGTQVLLIDTAGRLHNKAALMEELRKIIRVLRRLDGTAPHSVLLTLDATTGQNALQQVKVFKEMVDVTGLAVTKLDGSAKGGVVVALAQEFGLPVHMVGVGEKAGDLRPFEARDFARGLVGVE